MVKPVLSESTAFLVKNERLSLNIAILDIDSLHLHEATIPELLEQLTRSIKADGLIKHPVIVDRTSLVVLDGVHRVAALKRLRIKRIPASLVDYKNPSIMVCSWYRTISGASTLKQILANVEQAGTVTRKVEDFEESIIGVSPTVATVRFRKETFLVNSSFQNLRDAYNVIERIEECMRADGLRIRYETELDAFEDLLKKRVDAVLCPPRLTKQEIVKAALAGQTFASKATRHIIPARLMGLNVPLSLLRIDRKPLSEVNGELNRMLRQRRLKRVPSGSVLDGRRYEEELYIFER